LGLSIAGWAPAKTARNGTSQIKAKGVGGFRNVIGITTVVIHAHGSGEAIENHWDTN